MVLSVCGVACVVAVGGDWGEGGQGALGGCCGEAGCAAVAVSGGWGGAEVLAAASPPDDRGLRFLLLRFSWASVRVNAACKN